MEGLDFQKMFYPDIHVLEIIIRGTVVYLSLFFLLRVTLKRESGTLGIPDLLVVVLLADASQNAMAGDYKSITDGLILVATIIFWSYFIDWLGFRVPFIQRLVKPPKLLLVKEGRMIRGNMKKEIKHAWTGNHVQGAKRSTLEELTGDKNKKPLHTKRLFKILK
jgi:hypothetical protein